MRFIGRSINGISWGIFVVASVLWASLSAWEAATAQAALFGIQTKYLNLVGVIGVIVSCLVLIVQYRMSNLALNKLLDPQRHKIDSLRGIETAVERFFDGRDKELRAEEYMRVLGTQLMDAREHGLYDASEFSEERAAMLTASNAVDVAANVISIMKRKRHAEACNLAELPVKFQKWFLEDIRREIQIEEEMLDRKRAGEKGARNFFSL